MLRLAQTFRLPPAVSRAAGRESANAGFVLVAVLWLLAALATLAVVYSLYMRESAAAFTGHDDRLKAQALIEAGVELAVYQLTAVPDQRPSQGRLNLRMGGARLAVEFRAENGLIDINAAPRELLAGLFTGFGMRREDADEVSARIAGWRSPATQGAGDNETPLYRAAGLRYGPRRGPFQHVNELALVLGMPGPLLDRALPHLTVYSGQPEINLLVAAPEVLAALPGVTPEWLKDLVLVRENAPQDVLRARLGTAARYITVQPGNATRIFVDVMLDTGRRIRAEVVVLAVNGDAEPYRVLAWHDDMDELTGERPRVGGR